MVLKSRLNRRLKSRLRPRLVHSTSGGGSAPFSPASLSQLKAWYADYPAPPYTQTINGTVRAIDRSGQAPSPAIISSPCGTFDGSTSFVDTGTDFSLSAGSPVTVTAWIYIDGTSINNSAVLISGGNGGDPDGLLISTSVFATTDLQLGTQNILSKNLYVDGSVVSQVPGNISSGQWVHIAVSGTIDNVDGGSHFIAQNDNGTNKFEGKIADLRIYGAILSQSDIQAIHNRESIAASPIAQYAFSEGSGSTIYDRSTNANHGTATAVSWANTQNVFDTSFSDGFRFSGGAIVPRRTGTLLAADGSALDSEGGILASGQSLDLSGGDPGSAYSLDLLTVLSDLVFTQGDANEANALFSRNGEDLILAFAPALSGQDLTNVLAYTS